MQVLTARQVPEVRLVLCAAAMATKCTPLSAYYQMVLIYPVVNEAAGTLDINFPHESGCPSFSVPLRPNDQHFATWETCVLPHAFPLQITFLPFTIYRAECLTSSSSA